MSCAGAVLESKSLTQALFRLTGSQQPLQAQFATLRAMRQQLLLALSGPGPTG